MTTFKPFLFLVGAVLVIALLGSASYIGNKEKVVTSTMFTSCTSSISSTNSNISKTVEAKSYSYSSSFLTIKSVKALIYNTTTGQSLVFEVSFENTGNSTLYLPSACGGGLYFAKSNSSIIRIENRGAVCLCATILIAVNHGEVQTSVAPGCWSGYAVLLEGHGNVEVTIELRLYADSNYTGIVTTSIDAVFNL
jgi:hypothetical protein